MGREVLFMVRVECRRRLVWAVREITRVNRYGNGKWKIR